MNVADHDRAAPSRSAGLAEGRRADSARRRQRVITAIATAAATGAEISVSAIARRAAVDRSFLYRHRDLLTQVHTAAERPADTASGGPGVSRASLHADLTNCQDRCHRLTQRARQLEDRLSEALGDAVWRATGLGAPDDIAHLQARIVTLEQELADVRLDLDDRETELTAARAANRELMTRLNGRTIGP